MNIQEFFSSIIESMPSALITVDAELQIKQINSNARSISQNKDSSVLNAPVIDAFPMLKNHRDEIYAALQNSQTITLDRVEYSDSELSNYYKIICYPLSEIKEVIVIQIEDVTQRELLEQRVLQSEKMQSMDGLAAGIAHEVNNPLSAIINGVQNINRRLDSTRPANIETAESLDVDLEKLNSYLKQREIDFFLESIEEGALRASNVVSNMLKFSTSEVHSKEPCDINLLIQQAIRFVKKDYELHDQKSFNEIEIESDLQSTLPSVKILPMELQQVFINLLRNAEQAISARKETASDDENYAGKITIETKLDRDTLNITIADNGCGMNDNILRKAFDPYFSTRRKTGGHGLGLAMVYRIVKSVLDGEIEVRSTVNIGTQFLIQLKTMK